MLWLTATAAPILVQYGPPRTATTFQFQILCASACLKSPDAKCMVCKDEATLGVDVPVSEIAPGTVCKVHDREKAQEIRDKGGVLFTTEPPGDFVQHFEDVAVRGRSLVFDYAQILNLTVKEAHQIATFVRYWEILRRCCGAQMSTDYRHRLFKGSYNLPTNMIHFRAEDDPSFDACEIYNIDQVERRYVHTAVFRKCNKHPLIRKLSDVDQPLDGSYCKRALNATIEQHLIFNDPRYLQIPR